MKKILLLLFLTMIVQASYSQITHHGNRKQPKPKNCYVSEIDTCFIVLNNPITSSCDNIQKGIQPPPVRRMILVYPIEDDLSKWMLAWEKEFKGASIAY